MKSVTLCYLVDLEQRQILLGLKKTGFGQGKVNGFGGKLEPGESAVDAACREMREETGIQVQPHQMHPVAELEFHFPTEPDWDQQVTVYLANHWNGEPQETREMRPFWAHLDHLPYDQMWSSDRHWLPQVLAGEKIRARVVFAEDLESVAEYIES